MNDVTHSTESPLIADINTTTLSNSVNDVNSLLAFNDTQFEKFKKRPLFDMIRDGELTKDEKKRKTFFDYMQIFADHFQTMMQIRQASCCDPKFLPIFLTHFIEELGHDELLRHRPKASEVWDAVLVAVSTWFVHQMQVLDNIEKMVLMHLVVEQTGDYYHTLAKDTLASYIDSDYYQLHAEHDADHVNMAIDLLPGYPSFVYERLGKISKEGWYMMYTMVDRVYALVKQNEQTISEVK